MAIPVQALDMKCICACPTPCPTCAYEGSYAQAESWAFALDSHSLGLMMEKGIFWTRTCKVCHGDEGIVVASEYGMSKAILEAGFNLATLMSRCARVVLWGSCSSGDQFSL